MKGILLLNGEPYEGVIDDNGALVVCCDGAYEWARHKARIDKNVGDFDSLGYSPAPHPEEVYPSEKDYTDGEIALFKLFESGVDDIEIYGGGGGREDHFLGNLHLLYSAHKRGVKVKMITARSVIFPASGAVEFKDIEGATISVLPFGGKVHIMGSTGLKYSYPQALCYGVCRGLSNVVESECARLELGGGDTALIIINRGEV